jgi:hypothetical protein
MAVGAEREPEVRTLPPDVVADRVRRIHVTVRRHRLGFAAHAEQAGRSDQRQPRYRRQGHVAQDVGLGLSRTISLDVRL